MIYIRLLTPSIPHWHLEGETSVEIPSCLDVSLIKEMESLTLSKYE